jgi:hypothetical protein
MTTKSELLRNVRIFCSECVGGPRSGRKVWPIRNPGDVDQCPAKDCIWYEYRFAVDPRPSESRVEIGRK